MKSNHDPCDTDVVLGFTPKGRSEMTCLLAVRNSAFAAFMAPAVFRKTGPCLPNLATRMDVGVL